MLIHPTHTHTQHVTWNKKKNRRRRNKKETVPLLTTLINHSIYRRTTTKYFTTWIPQTTSIETWLDRRVETPACFGMLHCVEVTKWHMNPWVRVLPTCLHAQDFRTFVGCRQSICHNTTSRTSTKNNVIICILINCGCGSRWSGCSGKRMTLDTTPWGRTSSTTSKGFEDVHFWVQNRLWYTK